MPFECPQDVANDYEKLFNSNEGYDVIIYAGNDDREIHAHSLVLRTRSQHFFSYQSFNMILRFIYCGKIDLDQLGYGLK
ncbi:BTB/POZ domain-containing protein [Rhizophagus clarus]|uniref:BTB/POZ domain-containing protein n=1 Tax=Rhizophagus clarus TaxID=94130 RepID=A0A8H3L5I3_9GLOM|nr:BTB/POZ domain-containing protein [Rhizophagus clarus]